ncbi:hypothetical protein BV25DRAFT_1165407 [Artomyces pyxidatus]|uniref:Uncharacterized protein n=1 Tax=Artomyces pyxidatus TaxID=48021 RepID=A0ACB8SSE0_9AGAM|nr:hypothetical protein BV25DRAFT_1165407 [Artomyces pyxidatus]
MMRLPVELWTYIFLLACTHDGPTSRALALTCYWFKAISESSFYQLQHLSVTHLSQFASLATMLERRPAPALRPVMCLKLKARVGGPAPPPHGATHAYPSAYDTAALAHRILAAVAPTLRVLHLDISDARAPLPLALVPMRLPVLEELGLRGDREVADPAHAAPATLLPALRRLRVSALGPADVAILSDMMALRIALAVRDVYISGAGVYLPFARRMLKDAFAGARSESLRAVHVVIDLHPPPWTVNNSSFVLAEHYTNVEALRDVAKKVGATNLQIKTF